MTTPAQAQAPPDADRAAERIQREQQEQQEQQIEQQRRNLPAPKSTLEATETAAGADNGGPCRDIREVAIASAPNLPATERTRITKAYSARCLRVHDIEQLLAEITNSYIRRGYVTTRVYLPEQDLSGGKLSVMVVEGVVEKMSLSGKFSGRVSLGSALPGVEGQPLNLRDLEQGLDQINRLQSNHATVDIEPGDAPGASRIVIHNESQRAFHFGATLDSMGQETTGRSQAGLSGSLDSPFGLNDYANLTYRQSLPLNSASRQSQLGSFVYLVPYGYSTTSLSYSRSDYNTLLRTGSGDKVDTEGSSEIVSARFEDVLHRSRSNRITFSAGVTTKASRNYLAGQFLIVSSRNLTVADTSLNYTTGLLGGVVTLESGYSWGLKAFGALDDADGLAPDAPRAQFRRLNYSASYSLPFRAAGLDASFGSTLSGQRAQTALYGSEQVLAGGIYSVRGFDQTSLTGDNGFVWRNELAVRQRLNWGTAFQGVLRPYLALDYGRTRMREGGTGTPEGAVSGAAAGLSLSSGSTTVELFNSRPVHVPSFMTRESSQTYFRFSMSL
ncbi:MAG: ShlB/FhaC/HecB family hemolysin secretion/activation protein [Gammaproteobacteria bacterium]